jgi:hypothetical protein
MVGLVVSRFSPVKSRNVSRVSGVFDHAGPLGDHSQTQSAKRPQVRSMIPRWGREPNSVMKTGRLSSGSRMSLSVDANVYVKFRCLRMNLPPSSPLFVRSGASPRVPWSSLLNKKLDEGQS